MSPSITTGRVIDGRADETLMVWTPAAGIANVMTAGEPATAVGSAFTATIAARREPAPESAVVVTTRTTPADAAIGVVTIAVPAMMATAKTILEIRETWPIIAVKRRSDDDGEND